MKNLIFFFKISHILGLFDKLIIISQKNEKNNYCNCCGLALKIFFLVMPNVAPEVSVWPNKDTQSTESIMAYPVFFSIYKSCLIIENIFSHHIFSMLIARNQEIPSYQHIPVRKGMIYTASHYSLELSDKLSAGFRKYDFRKPSPRKITSSFCAQKSEMKMIECCMMVAKVN